MFTLLKYFSRVGNCLFSVRAFVVMPREREGESAWSLDKRERKEGRRVGSPPVSLSLVTPPSLYIERNLKSMNKKKKQQT